MYETNNKMEGILTHLNKKGLAAFYSKEYNPQEKILLKDYLLYPVQFERYSEEIKKRRNTLIYMISWQIIASLFSMLYILKRRSLLYFFINFISICCAVIGLVGIAKMKAIFLMIHCVFTTSITGGFFFFQLVDYLLVSDTTHGTAKRLGDDLLLIIFSLPYLYDAVTGIINYLFLNMISQFKQSENTGENYIHQSNESEMKELSSINVSEIENHVNEEKLCIICCILEKNSVMNPCGHMMCCIECSEVIMKKNNIFNSAKCPICREKITGFIRLINS